MDKYEYKIKVDEIKNLIAQKEYAEAAEIADTIDWNRVKSVMMLCMISDVYKINRRYEDAENLLLMADERRPGGKTIYYSLCELSIKTGKFVEAYNYYKEFMKIAPQDPGCYVLQYKLYEAQEVSLEERIAVLEELKKRDYREKWAYELAYLYHRVGLATRCVEECDELILWFGEGKYVIKAMELKMLHEPLTEAQQEKYDHRYDEAEGESERPAENPTGEIRVPEGGADSEEYMYETGAMGTPEEGGMQETDIQENGIQETDSQENSAVQEELDIQVKTMDMSRFNTMNLQAELAAGLKEVLSDEQKQAEEVTRAIVAPMLDTDSMEQEISEEERAKMPVPEGMSEIMPIEEEQSESAEPGEEGEPEEAEKEVTEEEPKAEENSLTEEEPKAEENSLTEEESKAEEEPQTEENSDTIGATVMEEMRQKMNSNEEHAMTSQPPEQMAKVLTQEADGQIRLVMPEKESVEKQITGQMDIQDILNEWEKLKKENEERRKEEVRRHVLQHTGDMFTEFEAAVRDGLLEQIESGVVKLDTLDETTRELLDTTTPVETQETEAVREEQQVETEAIEAEEETAEEEEKAAEEVAEEEEAAIIEEPEAEAENAEQVDEEIIEETETETGEEVTENIEEAEELQDYGEVEEIEEIEEIEENDDIEVAEDETNQAAPQEETSPQQDRPKVRALTKEEEELFEPFIQSRSGREKLIKAVDSISLAAYTGNVIITGAEGMDTLTLAQNMIRDVQLTDSNFSGKVAKISGKGLNSKDVNEIFDKLKSGALIITKASDMKDATLEALYRALQQENFGIIIVMEDTKKAMDKLLHTHSKLGESFTARLNVEAMSNSSLVAYGRKYAYEQEYAIDDFGVLALHTRIEELQTVDHAVTVAEVKEIIDEAIRHANRKNLKHFIDILVSKRYDKEDMIILTEKDFV